MIRKMGLYRDKRNKRRPWVVRWFGEYDPNSGKQRRYSQSFRLKAEAEAFMAEQTAAFRKGQRRDKPEEIRLEDFCRDWLKVKKTQVRPETVKLYGHTIRRLLSYFGADHLLAMIGPRAAAMFMAELRPMRGETLSAWTVHRTVRNCKTIFTDAVNWQLIIQNPFKTVKAPKLPPTEWYYLRPDEYKRLLKATPGLRCKTLYALAYTTGLRFGELYFLTWADVDFEKGEIRISNRPGTATMPPFHVKDYEARTIALPKHTQNILEDLKTYNEATDQTPCVLLDDRRYKTVLTKYQVYRQQKRPWRNQDMANNTLREFRRHLRHAAIEPDDSLTIHTLRKCCIQNWADTISNPEVVRVLAGHGDLKTTMQYYCQAGREQRQRAAEAVDLLLAEAK